MLTERQGRSMLGQWITAFVALSTYVSEAAACGFHRRRIL